jgi:hypothetical protein
VNRARASFALLLLAAPAATDNARTEREKADGWVLLFEGKTLDGWMTSGGKPSRVPTEDGCINPHRCGGYLLVHQRQWEDFVLALDFKIIPGCGRGVFVRTCSLTPRPGKDVDCNGIEVAIDDTAGAGYHDTGALHDLVKPARAIRKPTGEWDHLVVTCDRNAIAVELNGEKVTRTDLDERTRPNLRPDGSRHKFDVAYKEHPRKGYLGLQDHGSPCWFKSIKIRPLK